LASFSLGRDGEGNIKLVPPTRTTAAASIRNCSTKVEVLDQMELSVIVARRRPVGSQRAQITPPAAT